MRRLTCLVFKELLVKLAAEAPKLAWGSILSPTGVARSNGGSSGDEKSELSNVDNDTHSSK